MDILRITARWSGFTGAPGYSAFHFSSDAGFWDGGVLTPDAESAAGTAATRVHDAFVFANKVLPSPVVVNIEAEAEILNSDTGEILGVVPVADPGGVAMLGDGGWSAASGAVVNWRTNDYRFGRRIRGRTFLVPLAGSAYQSDGTLLGETVSDLERFAGELVGSAGGPEFGVWSRPRGGSGGVFATVVTSNIPDMAAVLRSRRD